MASKQWEEAYERLKPKIAEAKAILDAIDFTGGPWAVIQKLWAAAQEAVEIVEAVALEVGGLTGEEKKKLAVQAADDIVSLPFYLEWVDGPAFSFAIDRIVAWFNKKTGAEAAGVSFLKA